MLSLLTFLCASLFASDFEQLEKNEGHYFNGGDLDSIIGHALYGTGQCVALVQHFTNVGVTSGWREGSKITPTQHPSKGCAIATFFDGKYPNWSHGNHACFFHSMESGGMNVVEQWVGLKHVQKRLMRFTGKGDENDAGKYSVIA
jgi:hypothetical protein